LQHGDDRAQWGLSASCAAEFPERFESFEKGGA
jgi:hypothetical protein